MATSQKTLDEALSDECPEPEVPASEGVEQRSKTSKQGVIYARVSTDEQADDGNGLEGQVSRMQDVAESKDIGLPFKPITDKGESGREFERPGLQKLLKLAQREEITHVLVENTNRLGRRAPQTLSMIDLIQRGFGTARDDTDYIPSPSGDSTHHESALTAHGIRPP